MMTNPVGNTGGMPPASALKEQSKKGLREFFQQKSVRNLVNVLVPSALAAILFPIFGPVVAGGAAAVAIQNGLKFLGISFSAGSVEKILKPLEGRQIDENDVQSVLEDLLPKDKQVNDEAAKALVTAAPDIKEAALTNPKLDPEWLSKSLEISLKDQGWAMEKIAPQLRDLILLDGTELLLARDRLLVDWPRISQEVAATGYSKVSDVEQNVEGRGGEIRQRVGADDHSTITGVRQIATGGQDYLQGREDDPDHGKIP